MIHLRDPYVSSVEQPLQQAALEGGEMKDLTRRSFLTHSSIGVALAGTLALVPAMSAAMKMRTTAPKGNTSVASAGIPFVAHVRDLGTGEIAFLVGSERFIIRDRELAGRLHSAATSR
jgi:hypothetical protein